MHFQPYFSLHSFKLESPIRSTPWGRFRHGCDPPIPQVWANDLIPLSRLQPSLIEGPFRRLPPGLAGNTPFFPPLKIPWTQKPQVGQLIPRILNPATAFWPVDPLHNFEKFPASKSQVNSTPQALESHTNNIRKLTRETRKLS
jgi:hypothetical protein